MAFKMTKKRRLDMAAKKILGKTVMSSLVMIFLLLFVGFSFASELDDIRAAIKEKGAKWSAGETSVSKLPPEQRKLRLGLAKHEITGTERLVSVEPPLSGLTSSFDWRNNDYVTPVRNQGNCGSCWAFATTAALESYLLIRNNGLTPDLTNLAEQILVSCSRAGSCGGGYIDRASNFIRDTGLPEESCYPYTATNGNCRKACNDWRSNTDWIDSWFYVATTLPTADAIKNALYANGPLVTTMDVYSDFFDYTSGIYSYVHGSYQGGHAILIVGYDDEEGGYFIVKNSWGTGWGEGGFFKIAYSQLSYPVEFGYWTIAYQGAPPAPPSCSYSISPTSDSFKAAGGPGTIAVTADTNCSWTAVSNASWITVTSGGSGTGNGSVEYVEYNVARNKGKKARSGTITVAGEQFEVTQEGR
jgi:C1A family cysteine protease